MGSKFRIFSRDLISAFYFKMQFRWVPSAQAEGRLDLNLSNKMDPEEKTNLNEGES